MIHPISPILLAQLRDAIAAQMGLHFPKARWRDLERGIDAAAREFMVRFASRNGLDEADPSLLTHTAAVDVILCRNVLMYLAPEQAQKVVQNLYRALADGGWLIVSPSETSQVLDAPFLAVDIAGAIFYKKDGTRPPPRASCAPRETPADALDDTRRGALPPPGEASMASRLQGVSSSSGQGGRAEDPSVAEPRSTPYVEALALYQRGRYAAVVDNLSAQSADEHADALALLARACANQGRLTDARQWCERTLAADKLNAGMHYLHATILQEQGAVDEAIGALKRALYLDQYFVLAHVALGTLTLRQGKFQVLLCEYLSSCSNLRAKGGSLRRRAWHLRLLDRLGLRGDGHGGEPDDLDDGGGEADGAGVDADGGVEAAATGGDGSGGLGDVEHRVGERAERVEHKADRERDAEPARTGAEAEVVGGTVQGRTYATPNE